MRATAVMVVVLVMMRGLGLGLGRGSPQRSHEPRLVYYDNIAALPYHTLAAP